MLIYIILGIIQGFTEPIPISSSGHIIIFKNILNVPGLNDLNFEIFSNFGSFLAIIIIFKKDIKKLIKEFILYAKTKNNHYKNSFNYSILIIIGTIPAAITGLFASEIIEKYFTNIKIIGLSLIITAFFLFIIRKLTGEKNDNDISKIDSLKIGLFQVIALIPGISRSGATLVGAMLTGLTRKSAFKFSFMLYIPITIATMILGFKNIIESNITISLMINYIIGAYFAFLVTLITTTWFKDIIIKGKLIYFVYYCLFAGIFVLIFL